MNDKTLKVFDREDFEALKNGYFSYLGKKSVEARRKKYGNEGLSALMKRAGEKGRKKRYG